MSALITNEMVDLAAREARAWGVVSKHGEWTDSEAQQQCARDMLTAAEWITQRRTALDLLSAYEGLREMAGDLTAAVAVGSLGIRGADITAAEDDARTSLPRALDALEAVLEVVRLHRREPATDGSVDEYDYVGELADEFERAIESALEGKP